MFSGGFGAPGTRQTRRKTRDLVGCPFTQGGGLGGLALGYYPAAPVGLLAWPHYGTASGRGEPLAAGDAGRSSRLVSVGFRPARLRSAFAEPAPMTASRLPWAIAGLGVSGLLCRSACISASDAATSTMDLPGPLPMNPGAGKGMLLLVEVQADGGQRFPCAVDTGSPNTVLPARLEPTLGNQRCISGHRAPKASARMLGSGRTTAFICRRTGRPPSRFRFDGNSRSLIM